MPNSITIKFKDGTEKEFPHRGRSGGSYTKNINYKDGWVIVIDEWDEQNAFPSDTIKQVIVKNHR